MASEVINAEGAGSINNHLRRSISALARTADAWYIASRTHDSKAARQVEERFFSLIPYIHWKKHSKSFKIFLRAYGEPASAYCGRNEFSEDSESNCPNNCEWQKGVCRSSIFRGIAEEAFTI